MGAGIEQGTVHFYFWDHTHTGNLLTRGVYNLARLADTAYFEGVHLLDDEEGRTYDDFEKVIRQINEYIASGDIDRAFEISLRYSSGFLYHLPIMHFSGKRTLRIVYENNLAYPFDHVQEFQNIFGIAFTQGVSQALNAMSEFLAYATPYLDDREDRIVEQILACPGEVAAWLGIAHTSLEKRVAEHRPTTITKPYPACDMAYHDHLWNAYRKTGVVDKTLFLRALWESIANHAIDELAKHERGEEHERVSTHAALVANFTAQTISLELIERYIAIHPLCLAKLQDKTAYPNSAILATFLAETKQRTLKQLAQDAARALDQVETTPKSDEDALNERVARVIQRIKSTSSSSPPTP